MYASCHVGKRGKRLNKRQWEVPKFLCQLQHARSLKATLMSYLKLRIGMKNSSAHLSLNRRLRKMMCLVAYITRLSINITNKINWNFIRHMSHEVDNWT